MSIGESTCPSCGEPLPADPFEHFCPLAAPAPGSASSPPAFLPFVDPLGETIAYQPEGEAEGPGDGFPAVDDLIGRNLGQYRVGAVIGRGSMGRVYRGEHAG